MLRGRRRLQSLGATLLSLIAFAALVSAPARAAENASYRVYAAPLSSPLDGPRTLVINPSDPVESPKGWHDGGTTTDGPNAVAVSLLYGQAGPQTSPDGGPSRVFDFTIPDENDLSTFYPAAVTNAFYWANYLHDRLSQLGFDAVTGYNFEGPDDKGFAFGIDTGLTTVNAQLVQTFGHLDKGAVAYLFASRRRRPSLQVTAPAAIAGPMRSVAANFGPDTAAGGLTAGVALADDGRRPAATHARPCPRAPSPARSHWSIAGRARSATRSSTSWPAARWA